jgi:hypothetical protein
MRATIGSLGLDPMSSTTRIQRGRTCCCISGHLVLTLRDNGIRSILVTPQHFLGARGVRQSSGLRAVAPRPGTDNPGRGDCGLPHTARARPMPGKIPKAPTGSPANRTSGSAPGDAAARLPDRPSQRASARPAQRDVLYAGSGGSRRANVWRSFHWRRQAIGRQGLAHRSTDPSAQAIGWVANEWLTRSFFVGDTGFEPVTSSVSGQNLCPGTPASVAPGACAASPVSAAVRVRCCTSAWL